MNTFIVVFVAALAVANAGVIAPVGVVSHTVVAPAVKSTLIQGPSTSTHVVGPDGSQIIAHAPGASVSTAEHVAVASDVVAPLAYSAPVIHAAPLAYAAPIVAHAAHVVAAAPVLAFPAGHGIEGQYVPDLTEKLYDDGSYKGEIY